MTGRERVAAYLGHLSPATAIHPSGLSKPIWMPGPEFCETVAPVGGPAFQSHHQVLLHLYLCTLVPMLEGMQSWLYNSDSKEDSLPLDFFIRPGDV